MKKKIIKRFTFGALTLLLGTLLLVMYAPFSLLRSYRDNAFDNVLTAANIKGETLVSDIALLGAHDAFSSQINLLSKPDPGDDGIVQNKALNALFKGGMTRITKAQKDTARVLLNRGVRYFDVRISNVDGVWKTKHGFIDADLSSYIGEIYHFLAHKPREFIIFDIQHLYLGAASVYEFLTYLTSLTLNPAGLRLDDFIHFSRSATIETLEYADVQGGQTGGIILLLNDDGSATYDQQALFFPRDEGENSKLSIRSKWHNKSRIADLKVAINEEEGYLASLDETPYFRVNQAQLTPDYLKEPFYTIKGWSLLNFAAQSNKALLADEAFTDWLKVMPIFMVDFANSKAGSFNKRVNETMILYNSTNFA